MSRGIQWRRRPCGGGGFGRVLGQSVCLGGGFFFVNVEVDGLVCDNVDLG